MSQFTLSCQDDRHKGAKHTRYRHWHLTTSLKIPTKSINHFNPGHLSWLSHFFFSFPHFVFPFPRLTPTAPSFHYHSRHFSAYVAHACQQEQGQHAARPLRITPWPRLAADNRLALSGSTSCSPLTHARSQSAIMGWPAIGYYRRPCAGLPRRVQRRDPDSAWCKVRVIFVCPLFEMCHKSHSGYYLLTLLLPRVM